VRQKIIIFFILFCSVFGYAAETSSSTHIIRFEGNTYFDTDTLIEVVGAKKKRIFLFWEDDVAYIDDRLIPTIKPTLESFYESEGFYHAKIKIKEDNTTVIVYIDAGPPVIVKDINISSDFDISKYIDFRKGERFSAKKFVETKAKIIEALLEKGYCSYDLDAKAYIDLDKNSAFLKYHLKKGGLCTFGETTIKGLKTIEKDVVMSRVRARKGERFDPKKVRQTQEDIYKLESFESVNVSVDRKFFNVVPVDITVKEIEKAYHVEMGAGYDTYIGPRIHGTIVKKNFFGNAKRAQLKLSWSPKEQLAITDFYKPALFLLNQYYGIDFGIHGGYSNLEYKGFREEKEFLKTYWEHYEGRYRIKAGLGIENIRIKAEKQVHDQLEQAIKEGTFLLLYPFLEAVYDGRDDKLNPKYGYYFKGLIEYGLPYKAGASVYVKSYLETRLIHTFSKLTLAAVAKAGVVDRSSYDLPESKLFFSGGSFDNRAYGYRSIGVIISPTKDTIFGASTMLNLSLEADYPIKDKLYGAIFTDNTMLNKESYDFTGEVINTVGVGIRYVTPVGPFKFDIGFNIHDPSQYGITFQIGQSF